jgi:hypothetical protein
VNTEATVTVRCSRSETFTMLSSYDACIASIDAMLPQATAEAAARRGAAGPAVAALRADARYAPAREKYRKSVILQSAACKTSDGPATDTGCGFASSEPIEPVRTLRLRVLSRWD